jgi:PhnB protein
MTIFYNPPGARPRMLSRMTTPTLPVLKPHLIVAGAARAIAFYVEALGAHEVTRFVDRKLDDLIVNAELAIGDCRFTLSEESREWHKLAPSSLGGSPVLLRLQVEDADAAGARMERAGAKVVFPIADQFYGSREGRLVDPFGHLWVISQVRELLASDEIQRRIDRFHD